jgi:hypothetical protein
MDAAEQRAGIFNEQCNKLSFCEALRSSVPFSNIFHKFTAMVLSFRVPIEDALQQLRTGIPELVPSDVRRRGN